MNQANQTDNIERIERIKQLRSWLERKPSPKMDSADQISVAEDLGRLLDRLQTDGIRMSDVLIDAKKGSDGDSNKHLSQYIVRPGGTPGKSTLRVKAQPYADVALSASRLATKRGIHLSEDDVLLEVFGRANFWQSSVTRIANPEFDKLSARLRHVMEGISHKYRLTEFFKSVQYSGGILSPSHESVRKEMESGAPLDPQFLEFDYYFGASHRQIWPISFYVAVREAEDLDGDTVPVYPSAVLGTWKISDFWPSNEVQESEERCRNQNPDDDQKCELELRICIIPFGTNLQATPALRIRLEGNLSKSTEISPHIKSDLGTLPIPTDGSNSFVRRTWFLPIRGQVCQTWFQVLAESSDYDPKRLRLADRERWSAVADRIHRENMPSDEFRSGTLASVIHRCLCDPSDGIDFLLSDSAELRCSAYRKRLEDVLHQNETGWSIVEKRWHNHE